MMLLEKLIKNLNCAKTLKEPWNTVSSINKSNLINTNQMQLFRIVKFSSVYNLTLHFPKNFGAEKTKIYYIGLRGEFTSVRPLSILNEFIK